MKRTKKGRKLFTPKNLFPSKNKEINKIFDKSNLLFYYCQNPGHFAWNFHTRKRRKGIFHASTIIEETSKNYALEEKETRREYYLVSDLFRSLSMGEDTWLIDNVSSNHMSGFKGAISNIKEKIFACMV